MVEFAVIFECLSGNEYLSQIEADLQIPQIMFFDKTICVICKSVVICDYTLYFREAWIKQTILLL
jgi:hypothetical protein